MVINALYVGEFGGGTGLGNKIWTVGSEPVLHGTNELLIMGYVCVRRADFSRPLSVLRSVAEHV